MLDHSEAGIVESQPYCIDYSSKAFEESPSEAASMEDTRRRNQQAQEGEEQPVLEAKGPDTAPVQVIQTSEESLESAIAVRIRQGEIEEARAALEVCERFVILEEDRADRKKKREIEERQQILAEREFEHTREEDRLKREQEERHHQDQINLERRKQDEVETQNEFTRDMSRADFDLRWGFAILFFLAGILFLVYGSILVAGPLIGAGVGLAIRQVTKAGTHQ